MNPSQLMVLRTALTVAATPAMCCGAGYLLDPVVTYTNGMRLASTTAERSHNVYWRCSPIHLGYCDGRMYSPCRNDLRALGTRDHGQFAPPCTPRGPVSGEAMHVPDGMEDASSESIGVLPLDSATARTLGAGATPPGDTGPAPAAPAGGIWIDALKTLGRKASASVQTPPVGS